MINFRICIECRECLSVENFKRYSANKYREVCNTCWPKRDSRPMKETDVDQLREVIRRVFPFGGVKAVQAEMRGVPDLKVRKYASRMGIKYIRPGKQKTEHPDVEAVLKELQILPPGYALRAYRTPSRRITLNPIGKLCAVWERDIGRHGRTKRIDIAAAKAALIAAKGAA